MHDSALTRPSMIEDECAGETGIAIIGMAGRFPGARDVGAFWDNLKSGRESITFFSDDDLRGSLADPGEFADPRFVKARGVLEDAESFDAAFFATSPREAEITDPQHRVFLECCWSALEDAGHVPERFVGSIGVYGGTSLNTYAHSLLSVPAAARTIDTFQLLVGNDKDFLTTRVSYKLNLTGPSLTIQTACSSSLVAVHVACQSLLAGECDMALAGGVSVRVPQRRGYRYQPGGVMSPDGHCRAFDASAAGTVTGSGAGVVVLRRLKDAVREGDRILAVIRGSAVNNDGAAKVGYTAPSIERQAAVISEALSMAGVDPATVGYIEAHGTGTALGDPIEVTALARAFRERATTRPQRCGIGSVKTNIGHLDAAAGIAGLIKTVLALQHGLIPASLHFSASNPKIDFANTPFYVVTEPTPWVTASSRRRAGVSSFGVGGTNAHVVVEEAPWRPPLSDARPWHLLVLSARSERALDTATARLARWCEEHPQQSLADVAYTLQTGRASFPFRRAAACATASDALDVLGGNGSRRPISGQAAEARPIVFMFPGQGSQEPAMGRRLYATEPAFREHIDRCTTLLDGCLDIDLRSWFAGADGAGHATGLEETSIVQPALFSLEYALARLWQTWGIQPAAMIGHSVGEYTAACLAGVFSLEDALALIAGRAGLMHTLPRGGMLAVASDADVVTSLLDDRQLAIAAINAPRLCAVSGPLDAIAAFERELRGRHIACRRLRTSHAFHSEMVDPILGRFRDMVRRVTMQPPQVPIVSTVTGAPLTAEEATDPDYWVTQLRNPVNFLDGLRDLARDRTRILLEVGPGKALTSAARETLGRDQLLAVPSLTTDGQDGDEARAITTALGRLWVAGAVVDWSGVHRAAPRRRAALPTYPFERRRHWIDVDAAAPREAGESLGSRDHAAKTDPTYWLYAPYWKPAPISASPAISSNAEGSPCWLILKNASSPLAEAIVEGVRARGCDVIVVERDTTTSGHDPETITLDPATADFDRLLADLASRGRRPERVLHLWTLPAANDDAAGESAADAAMSGFCSVALIARAMATRADATACAIDVVTGAVHTVTGREAARIQHAPMLAACYVCPQEYARLSMRFVDIDPADSDAVDVACDELLSSASDPLVAWRQGRRWLPSYEPVVRPPTAPVPVWRQRGVYLISGGFGHIGLALAEHLARTVSARLVLVGRSTIPDRDEWDGWLEAHDPRDRTSAVIASVRRMEACGAEVLLVSADIADEHQVRAAVDAAIVRFGMLHGVVHAAGVTGRRAYLPIARLGNMAAARAACERVWRAKVDGTQVLDRVLGDRPLDFRIAMTSLSGVLGGLGLSVYAAGNLFVDALVEQRAIKRRDAAWIAIDWDGWDFRDEQTRSALEPTVGGAFGMTPAEGVDCFERVLTMRGAARLVVSTGDLETRRRQWIQRGPLRSVALVGDADPAPSQAPVRATTVGADRSPMPPRDAIEAGVLQIWREALGVEEIGVDDNFFDLGGHSLVGITLVERLREHFQRNLPVDILFEAPTVAELAARLSGDTTRRRRSAVDAPILTLQPSGDGLPFFCVHPIGGGVFVYSRLARYLGRVRPFHGLQALALDEIGEEYDTIEAMASRYVDAVRHVQRDGPYMLGGFSFGGFVAFEMACQLRELGLDVTLLALMDAEPIRLDASARAANSRPLELHDAGLLAAYGKEVTLHLGRDAPLWSLGVAELEALEPEQRLATVCDELVRRNILSPGEGLPMLRRNLQGIRNRVKAMYAFRPRAYDGAVTLFKANLVNSLFTHLLATEVIADDDGSPWAPFCSRSVHTVIVPGEHNYMVQEPHVQVLAQRLQACMTEPERRAC